VIGSRWDAQEFGKIPYGGAYPREITRMVRHASRKVPTYTEEHACRTACMPSASIRCSGMGLTTICSSRRMVHRIRAELSMSCRCAQGHTVSVEGYSSAAWARGSALATQRAKVSATNHSRERPWRARIPSSRAKTAVRWRWAWGDA
jgi:hypothetical protein